MGDFHLPCLIPGGYYLIINGSCSIAMSNSRGVHIRQHKYDSHVCPKHYSPESHQKKKATTHGLCGNVAKPKANHLEIVFMIGYTVQLPLFGDGLFHNPNIVTYWDWFIY